MVISHTQRFVFVHIYRTGGSSVSARLIPYARLTEQLAGRFSFSRSIIGLTNVTFGLFDEGNRWLQGIHKHAKASEIRTYLGVQMYDDYFTFSFVRNPWDWQVSLYEYIKLTRHHKDHGVVKALTFLEFLRRQVSGNAPCQLDFLTDDKHRIIVTKIGRFESLDRDLNEICRFKELPVSPLPTLNASRRVLNYRCYYDSESVNLVATHFQPDIEYFGYKF